MHPRTSQPPRAPDPLSTRAAHALAAAAALLGAQALAGTSQAQPPSITEPILVDPSAAALQAELDDMARVAAKGQATPPSAAHATSPAQPPQGSASGALSQTVSSLIPRLRARAQAAPFTPPLSGAIALPAEPVPAIPSASGQPSPAQRRAWERLREHPALLTASPPHGTHPTTSPLAGAGDQTRVSYIPPAPPQPPQPSEPTSSTADTTTDPWAQLAQPGLMHSALNSLEGQWAATTQLNAGEGLPPIVVQGVMTSTWTMGRRWLHQTYKGSSSATGEFQGQGVIGFDNAARRFVASWTDSLSTTMIHSTGVLDEPAQELTLTGEFVGPDQARFTQRQRLRIESLNRYTITLDLITPQGNEVRTATTIYERLGTPLTSGHED